MKQRSFSHFSIIYCRTQAKQGRVSFETVTDVLQRFEKASAYLVSHAFISNDNQTRCKIIDFLCILLLEGVEYRMADPKRKVYDFVVAAMKSPTPDVLPILPHLLNFLIVLSMVDPTFVKPQELEKAAVTVCGKISEEKIEYGNFYLFFLSKRFDFRFSLYWAGPTIQRFFECKKYYAY